MQARVRFVPCARNPLRRSCVSSAQNAGESAICPVPAPPSAEIVRVECAKCRRECDLSGARATLCGDRACRAREMQASTGDFACSTTLVRGVSGELEECPIRVPHKSVPQECPRRVSHKSVPQECPTRVSHKSVLQECPTRVTHKSDPQDFPTRVTHKSVLQECPRRVSHKSVLQECHLDICSFSKVFAFGFVGSILFFIYTVYMISVFHLHQREQET